LSQHVVMQYLRGRQHQGRLHGQIKNPVSGETGFRDHFSGVFGGGSALLEVPLVREALLVQPHPRHCQTSCRPDLICFKSRGLSDMTLHPSFPQSANSTLVGSDIRMTQNNGEPCRPFMHGRPFPWDALCFADL